MSYYLLQIKETFITDGSAIEVSNDGQEVIYLDDDTYNSSLLKIDYNGKNLTKLTVDKIEYGNRENFWYNADFSKDNSKIVYEKQYTLYEYLD